MGRSADTRRLYGVTDEQYGAMLARQGGRCATCKRPPVGKAGHGQAPRLHIDHDHATGRVRGLLCHRCNLALGHVEDNPLLLDALKAYLLG